MLGQLRGSSTVSPLPGPRYGQVVTISGRCRAARARCGPGPLGGGEAGGRVLRTPPPDQRVRLPAFCNGRHPGSAVGRAPSTEHSASPASGHRNAFCAGNWRDHGPCTRQVRDCTFRPVYLLHGGVRGVPGPRSREAVPGSAHRPQHILVPSRSGGAGHPAAGGGGGADVSAGPRPHQGGEARERRVRAALQKREQRPEAARPHSPNRGNAGRNTLEEKLVK